jgi:plastocyanin
VKTHRAVILTMATVLGMAMASCGGGDDNPVNPGGGADVTINIVGNNGSSNSYSPDPDTISSGQTVSWHNGDATSHTATSTTTNAFGTGALAPGQTSVPVAINSTPRTINYVCTIHAGMTGTLVVR